MVNGGHDKLPTISQSCRAFSSEAPEHPALFQKADKIHLNMAKKNPEGRAASTTRVSNRLAENLILD